MVTHNSSRIMPTKKAARSGKLQNAGAFTKKEAFFKRKKRKQKEREAYFERKEYV